MARLISYGYIRQKALADPDSGEAVVYLQDIAEAPTEYSVEVARCKDCKNNGQCSIQDAMNWGKTTVNGENFCSHGERKDGDGNG